MNYSSYLAANVSLFYYKDQTIIAVIDSIVCLTIV
jgi:hypothetical protein